MVKESIENIMALYTPFPMCIINGQGKVTIANTKIDEVFIYDGIKDADIFALTGIKHRDIIAASTGEKALTLSRNEKVFKLLVKALSDCDDTDNKEEQSMIIYFMDITTQETLKKLYNEERVCLAVINVDNYDELIASTTEENRMSLTSEIDKTIRQWGARLNASVTKHKENMYFFIMESQYCDKMVENKFAILDDVREIETEADFPVTLSIGIGIGGKTFAQTDQYSQDALDLALGRGGDQAVIKNISKIEYYGGKSQSVEKRNKGKSRIVVHALRQLIDQSSKVIIMGHRNPDMDAFGASLGIYRMVANRGKDAYIVINNVTEGLAELYRLVKESEAYELINSDKALNLIDEDTLLVIVDTHRPSFCDCPALIEKTEKIAVIDHHRKAEESIENPTLAYMESYASSTSELVAEMFQYSGDKKNVNKLEVEALLAGITVDTNRFAVKTGVRTFEAAAWLRRSGADTTAVKRFFQVDQDAFLRKARCLASAQIMENGIALSMLEGEDPDAQILNSQVADELLTAKGVLASFVVGRDSSERTVISARSLGQVNVQVIMEKFGGGGHLTTAGAQVDMSPEEAIEEIKRIVNEKRFTEKRN